MPSQVGSQFDQWNSAQIQIAIQKASSGMLGVGASQRGRGVCLTCVETGFG